MSLSIEAQVSHPVLCNQSQALHSCFLIVPLLPQLLHLRRQPPQLPPQLLLLYTSWFVPKSLTHSLSAFLEAFVS